MSSINPTLTLTVPKEYGYVVLTATTSIAVGIFIMMRTGGYRKAAKIPYPQPYAFSNCNSADIDAATTASDKSTALNNYLFNCAQRAHGNFLENLPLFMPALLLAGLRYPTAAAVLGQIWNLGRVIYAVGYTSKEGKNGSGRLYGSVQYIGFLGLFGLLAKMGVDMVLA